VPFAEEICRDIHGYLDLRTEHELVNSLKRCAPVIGAFAERGVAWANINFDRGWIFYADHQH